jgi:hypothetical protein
VGAKLHTFGDRVQKEKPDQVQKKALQNEEAKNKRKDQAKGSKVHSKTVTQQAAAKQTVLTTDIQEDLYYRPKSRETMMVYDQMLSIVQRNMGDHSLEIIKGALDEVLAILKAEGLSAVERKSGIESLVDHLK